MDGEREKRGERKEGRKEVKARSVGHKRSCVFLGSPWMVSVGEGWGGGKSSTPHTISAAHTYDTHTLSVNEGFKFFQNFTKNIQNYYN